MDAAGFGDEAVPRVAAGIDDCLGVIEHAKRKESFSQVEPDALDRVEFGRIGRELHEGDVGRQVIARDLMPARAVHDHDGMGVLGQLVGEMVEEESHRLAGDLWQDEGDVGAVLGPDGGEDVGPLIAAVAAPRCPLAAGPPAMADATLVADPCFVLEPELYRLAGVGGFGRIQGVAEPLFMKAACAF